MHTKTQSLLLLGLAACASGATSLTSPVAQRPAITQESLADVFERVESSVVTIVTTQRTGQVDESGTTVAQEGIGSGVLVSDDGKILTASHVIQTADALVVRFHNGSVVPARILSSVPSADVALIQLTGKLPQGIKPAKLADSDLARIGSEVLVVGAPNGLSHTLTVGHLSARRELPTAFPGPVKFQTLQTDATINTGNSGGPMFDRQGRVIGIVSYIISKSGGSEGLGFAMAANVAKELLLDRNPFWTGMDFVVLNGDLARAFNLPKGRSGMLVQHVAKASPVERLGIRGGKIPVEVAGQKILIGGDIILSCFGVEVGDPRLTEVAFKKLGEASGSDLIELVILRDGKQLKVSGAVSDLTAPGK